MIFALKDIREIAHETIMGVEYGYRARLATKTRNWANDNAHLFLEVEGDTVHFDRDKFHSAVIEKAQDIAASKRYPLVSDLF